MFTTWRETLSFLRRMGLRKDGRLLILGSGGNGVALAVHALNLEVSRIAMVGSGRFSDAAARLGMHAFFDYMKPETPDVVCAQYPDGFDFVVDAVGKLENADRYLRCVCDGGAYSVYGLDAHGRIRIDPLLARGRVTIHPCTYEESEAHHEVVEFYLRGRLDAGIWYDAGTPFQLDDIHSAFAHVRARQALKALVKLR
jgi:D-arabinose 1-dehydrogenase-like Zn-dependent alcohol dehydrogenase